MQSARDGASSVLGMVVWGLGSSKQHFPAGSGAAFPLAAWHSVSPGATSELLFWVCNRR